MKGTRLVVGSVLAVAVAIVIIALSLPLYGWSRVLAIAVAVVAGACGISLAALMATIIFVKTGDDVWNTRYFRYMRAVWAKHWGGDGDLLQINVCRASQLGVLTLIGLFFAITLLVTPIWYNVSAIMHGIQTIYGENGDFGSNFPSLIFMSPVFPFFSAVVFCIILPMIQESKSRAEKIFILSVNDVVRIRTGEHGKEAI